jgi:hypothetical protein
MKRRVFVMFAPAGAITDNLKCFFNRLLASAIGVGTDDAIRRALIRSKNENQYYRRHRTHRFRDSSAAADFNSGSSRLHCGRNRDYFGILLRLRETYRRGSSSRDYSSVLLGPSVAERNQGGCLIPQGTMEEDRRSERGQRSAAERPQRSWLIAPSSAMPRRNSRRLEPPSPGNREKRTPGSA